MSAKSKNEIVRIAVQDLATLFQRNTEEQESLISWIRTVDLKTQLYLDKNFENIWQRSRELVINNPIVFNDFLLTENHENFVTQISSRNSRYESGQALYRIVCPNGEMRWIRDKSYYLFDKQNTAFAVVGIAESISPDRWHSIRQTQNLTNKVINDPSPFESVLTDFLKNSNRHVSKRSDDHLKDSLIDGVFVVELDDGAVSLSKRETDCLRCLATGMTAKETAMFLGISPRTVETYLDNMKSKTRSANKFELIAKLKKLI